MTELENKLVERMLEKVDLDKLIDRIDLDVLTDKIAEKAAELIVEKEFPAAPNNPVYPATPWIPGPSPNTPSPYSPITVMYGVTTTDFRPTASSATSAVTLKEEDHEGK